MKTNFVYPQYQGQSLLNVPSTILSLLGTDFPKPTLPQNYFQNIVGAEKIVLLLIDGLGFNLFEREALKYPFFKKLLEKGIYKKITSIFPSSTASASNTLNTGLATLEHGLPEWYVYFQEIDAIAQSLPFIAAITTDKEKFVNPPSRILLNQPTIYQKLAKRGVSSFTFCPKAYSNSFYNQQSFLDSQVCGYDTVADFMVSLRKKINQTSGKAYFYAYWPAVDHTEHDFGPWSEETAAEISLLSYVLEKELIDQIDTKAASRTALFITADHGLVETDLKRTIYLDELTGLNNYFQVSPQGKIILPSGSARDLYLHIKKDQLEEARQFLQEKLINKARVMTIDEALKIGLFGTGQLHPEFLNRIGNLMILPYENNTIWYRYIPKEDVDLVGQHGGLSEDEMLIPFISIRVKDLKN